VGPYIRSLSCLLFKRPAMRPTYTHDASQREKQVMCGCSCITARRERGGDGSQTVMQTKREVHGAKGEKWG